MESRDKISAASLTLLRFKKPSFRKAAPASLSKVPICRINQSRLVSCRKLTAVNQRTCSGGISRITQRTAVLFP